MQVQAPEPRARSRANPRSALSKCRYVLANRQGRTPDKTRAILYLSVPLVGVRQGEAGFPIARTVTV
jgi:hypothetical protein